MRTTLNRRLLALVAVVAAAVVGTVVTPSTASAAPVSGGSSNITVAAADVLGLARRGVLVTPIAPAAARIDAKTRTITATLPVTGGDADLSQLVGTVEHGGGLMLRGVRRGSRSVSVTALTLDLTAFTLTATVGGAPTTLADVSLTTWTPDGTQGALSGDLLLTAEGAGTLNAALKASIFAEGQSLGMLTTTVTTVAAVPVG